MDKNSIIAFSKFLASRSYVATTKPDFGNDGIESVPGFSRIFWEDGEIPYTNGFKTVDEVYLEWIESCCDA